MVVRRAWGATLGPSRTISVRDGDRAVGGGRRVQAPKGRLNSPPPRLLRPLTLDSFDPTREDVSEGHSTLRTASSGGPRSGVEAGRCGCSQSCSRSGKHRRLRLVCTVCVLVGVCVCVCVCARGRRARALYGDVASVRPGDEGWAPLATAVALRRCERRGVTPRQLSVKSLRAVSPVSSPLAKLRVGYELQCAPPVCSALPPGRLL